MWVPISAGVADAEIVLGVLIEIYVTLEYLMGASADLDVGAVAVEEVISLRPPLGLLLWPVAVVAAARTLI
jgi:hypothetical protein